MAWKSIVDQSRVKTLLTGTLAGKRVAHAYLFSGPEGSGQDPAAIEFAKALLCERSGTEACGECRNCLRVESLQHPNLTLVFSLPAGRNEKVGDPPLSKLSEADIAIVQEQLRLKALNPYHTMTIPKANTIKINSVRLIRKESSLAGFETGRRIFIILNAEELGDDASNALLKTLEEPPENTILILTTSVPDRLLRTIVSRCQDVRMAPLSAGEIQAALEEREKVAPDEAAAIAKLSGGNYARALQRLHSDLRERSREAVDFLRTALGTSREEIGNSIERIIDRYEKQETAELLLLLQDWLRDAMLLKEEGPPDAAPEDGESHRRLLNRYKRIDLPGAIAAVDRAVSLVDKNAYIPLVLLNLALALQERINPSEQTDVHSSPAGR
jgi:DNA polymerase-3 subunit delta'